MQLGLYLSVPFCRSKCSYCNFVSGVFSNVVFAGYVQRVCADIQQASQIAGEMGGEFEPQADSIYLGGGTPTMLPPGELERLFAAMGTNFEVAGDAEITVECAPGTLSDEVIAALLRCGVNRVSLGMQSFVDAEVRAVGRLHTRATTLKDIARLRTAGITNINLDLIAGLPHQTAESWRQSLDETIATGVPHVSVYMLEVDEDSRLGRELIAGGTRYHAHFVPDEDATADFYLAACERLDGAGVRQYEISNFARARFESRHNLKYWTRRPYFGFGVDAHSMLEAASDPYVSLRGEGHAAAAGGSRSSAVTAADLEAVRFSTPDSLDTYLAAAPLARTVVNSHAALEEEFFLGLRLVRGVDLQGVAARYGAHAVEQFAESIAGLQADGLVEVAGAYLRLTVRGRLLSNEVFERFISAPDRMR